jgi:Flp pilus assembly protein TadG
LNRQEMDSERGLRHVVIRNQGQTTIEFALIAIILTGLIFLIMDLGVMLFVNLTMQYAVREGARYAVTSGNNGAKLR